MLQNIKAKIVLGIVIPDLGPSSYNILSEHPDKYSECSAYINVSENIDSQIKNLYSKYLDLDSNFIKFINLKPYLENEELILPYFCIIPYTSYAIKNSYPISCNQYVTTVPIIRQILNVL